ncbi:MAG: sigma-70 family RNA polymerase sigma factor [bacterium]|nr:sigma-70 family RNA polymerase sigma factor [bacterium]
MEIRDDAELVKRLKAKEPSAMDELVYGYSGKIYGLAVKLLKNQPDAEDIVQDTLLKVFEKIDTFRGESALSSWIYRIALNFSYMKIRKGSKNEYASIDDHMPKFEKSGMHLSPVCNWAEKADDKLLRKEMKSHIMENIEKLSEKYKTVLVMRDIQGLSTSEVAEATGMTIPAVKSRLHRARLFLRDGLSDYYNGGVL